MLLTKPHRGDDVSRTKTLSSAKLRRSGMCLLTVMQHIAPDGARL
jgi:hypothetical protein